MGNLAQKMSEIKLENQKVTSVEETFMVNVNQCKHRLADMGYEERLQLNQMVDDRSTMELMGILLKRSVAHDIWVKCRGGTDPAMGFLHVLAAEELTTLKKLKELATEADDKRSKDLISLINEANSHMDVRLDQLPFSLLSEIALEISPKQHPVKQQQDPLWKMIASKAGLSVERIKNLDTPEHSSQMLNEMITVVNQQQPGQKVAWLANGFKEIERNDVLDAAFIFEACRKNGCIKVIEKNDKEEDGDDEPIDLR